MAEDERNSQARSHATFSVQEREKALARHNATKRPGEPEYRATPARESYEVRSPALRQEGNRAGVLVTWDKDEAMERAQKASQIPPTYGASVHKFDHNAMEKRLERIYTAGRVNPDHTQERNR